MANVPCQAMASYLMIWAPNDVLPVVISAVTGGGGITACTGAINVSPVTAIISFRSGRQGYKRWGGLSATAEPGDAAAPPVASRIITHTRQLDITTLIAV